MLDKGWSHPPFFKKKTLSDSNVWFFFTTHTIMAKIEGSFNSACILSSCCSSSCPFQRKVSGRWLSIQRDLEPEKDSENGKKEKIKSKCSALSP